MASAAGNRAFRSAPGEGQMLAMIGRLKASSAQTGGALEVIEYEGPGVPPPHVHRDHAASGTTGGKDDHDSAACGND